MTTGGTRFGHTPVPLGVLISGRGSNLRAVADAIDQKGLDARIVVVISNDAEAPGIHWARETGFETDVIPHRGFPDRKAYDRALADALRERGARLVCLAGFMRVVGHEFCQAFPEAIVNVHPSLLPAFPGLDAQRQAFVHGVTVSGVTVHLVTPELDAGPIVAQSVVPVRADDTVDALRARILMEEHRVLPAALQRLITIPWHIDGRRIVWSENAGEARVTE